MSIKTCREQTDLTQERLAAQIGIDRSTVAKWETGESLPRADKLPTLARLLGCTIDELLAPDDEETKGGKQA